MRDNTNIIGAHGKRRELDFYPTPPEVTEALIRFLEERKLLRKGDIIWECADGAGAMVDVFTGHGYGVRASDIQSGTDFLKTAPDYFENATWIITNPPFNQSAAFIEHAAETGRPFAFLLKSQYWHSAKRRSLFTKHPPAYVLPLTWRPDFTGKGSSLMDVCWCVWHPADPFTIYLPLEKPR